MTKDDIIRMAREAGLCDEEGRDDSSVIIENHLKRFAELVATAEREWIGLTEDEVAQAMYRADAIITGPMQFKFAKEIEAKLKERNT